MESNPRKRVRYMFDVHFSTVEEKDVFLASLKHIRERLTPPGRPLVDNRELMMKLFDQVPAEATHAPTNEQATTKSFLRNGGREMCSKRKNGHVHIEMIYLCRCLHW